MDHAIEASLKGLWTDHDGGNKKHAFPVPPALTVYFSIYDKSRLLDIKLQMPK